MTTDKELIRMLQRSALTIYEHAEKIYQRRHSGH